METNQRKKVLCPIETQGGKTYWMKIGTAFSNRDGSMNVYLNALPTNNKLQIRELDERDLKTRDDAQPRAEADQNDLPF